MLNSIKYHENHSCSNRLFQNADLGFKYAIKLAKELEAKTILMHTFETTVLYSHGMMMTSQLNYSVIYNATSKELKTY